MKCYRIYFETGLNFGIEDAHAVVKEHIPNYTLYQTEGAWEGTVSQAYVVEVIETSRERLKSVVYKTATALKTAFHQDAVLVTASIVEVTLV